MVKNILGLVEESDKELVRYDIHGITETFVQGDGEEYPLVRWWTATQSWSAMKYMVLQRPLFREMVKNILPVMVDRDTELVRYDIHGITETFVVGRW